jgi:hypothetical protein
VTRRHAPGSILSSATGGLVRGGDYIAVTEVLCARNPQGRIDLVEPLNFAH